MPKRHDGLPLSGPIWLIRPVREEVESGCSIMVKSPPMLAFSETGEEDGVRRTLESLWMPDNPDESVFALSLQVLVQNPSVVAEIPFTFENDGFGTDRQEVTQSVKCIDEKRPGAAFDLCTLSNECVERISHLMLMLPFNCCFSPDDEMSGVLGR